jgi:ABC-type transporter Mla subunit MlaD
MKQHQENFLLGLATILFVTLFIASVLFLYPRMQTGGKIVVIHFEQKDGMAPLKAGNPVLLSDAVQVGRVTDIDIRQLRDGATTAPASRRTVFVVRTEVNAEVPLYGNAKITTNQPAIGGVGYVSILDVGTPDVPLKGPIDGLPPLSFAAAISSLSQQLLGPDGLIGHLNMAVDPTGENSLVRKMLVSLDDVNAMTSELRSQMNPQEQAALLAKVHRILDDLNSTTGVLRSELSGANDAALLARVHLALGHLDAGLVEAAEMLKENRPVVRETLENVRHVTNVVDQELLARVRTELDPTNPLTTMGKLHQAMDRVNAALANVQAMTEAGERIVALSQPEIERTLQNFVAMSEQLRQASQEVLLNPSKLIWGPSRGREEQLLVFQAASSFAEAASRLDAAAGRLEAVLRAGNEGELSPAARKELQAIYNEVQASFQRFGRAEEVLWQQLQAPE